MAAGAAGVGAAAAASATPAVAASEWKRALPSLLLSLRMGKRQAAFEQLRQAYDAGAGDTIEAEVEEKAAAAGRAFWGRFRLCPFFGYGSGCAALRRILTDYMTSEEGDMDKRVAQRGALFSLLRQLVGSTVWSLEAGAARAQQQSADSFDVWLARTPNLETPKFEVLFRDPNGTFEVRKYAPYSVVRTGKVGQGPEGGGTSSFFALANYIFGKANVKQEKMAMTTPVEMDRKRGTMSFIMPSRYWGDEALQSAPSPTEQAGVELETRPEEIVAVSVFGGYAGKKVVARKMEALLESVGEREGMAVVDESATRLLQYNDPFTVPWKRRNEVSVPVRLDAGA